MIKHLKHSLFAVVLIVGFSITASAQKEDDKKPPPKPKPPIIVVNDKKPKEEKPKDDKKPEARIFWKKNEMSFAQAN